MSAQARRAIPGIAVKVNREPRRRIAVAVNRDVVPRSRLASHALAAGDRVEILEAVGGG